MFLQGVRHVTRTLLAFVCSLPLMLQSAQDHPAKPGGVIEPFGVGGVHDLVARWSSPLQPRHRLSYARETQTLTLSPSFENYSRGYCEASPLVRIPGLDRGRVASLRCIVLHPAIHRVANDLAVPCPINLCLSPGSFPLYFRFANSLHIARSSRAALSSSLRTLDS